MRRYPIHATLTGNKRSFTTTLITKENFQRIVWPLPAGDLLYVGRSTKKRLARINVHTIGDLAALPHEYIKSYLGKNGTTLWIFANGLDESPVSLATDQRIIKSVGNSATTARDMICDEDIWKTIVALSDQIAARMRKYRLVGNTIAGVIDNLRLRFGGGVICRGILLDTKTDLLPEGQFGWNNGGFSKSMNDK